MAYEEEEKKQYMVIKIKKPHHAERLAWIVVVALLLSIVMYQWIIWPDASAECDEDSCASICEELAPVTAVKDTTTTKTEPKTDTTKTTETTTKPTTTENKTEETKVLSGKINFKILSVKASKKTSESGYLGIIKYTIDNQKKDFVPLVRCSIRDKVWNETTLPESIIEKKCQDTPLYELPLKAGAPILEKTLTPTYPLLIDIDESKNIILKLYDKKDTTKLLASAEYQLLASAWK